MRVCLRGRVAGHALSSASRSMTGRIKKGPKPLGLHRLIWPNAARADPPPCGIGPRAVRPSARVSITAQTEISLSSNRSNRARASLPPGIRPLFFETFPARQAPRASAIPRKEKWVKIHSTLGTMQISANRLIRPNGDGQNTTFSGSSQPSPESFFKKILEPLPVYRPLGHHLRSPRRAATLSTFSTPMRLCFWSRLT